MFIREFNLYLIFPMELFMEFKIFGVMLNFTTKKKKNNVLPIKIHD